MAKQQAEEQNEDRNKIDGIPSKELFIDMLVKDLSLKDAIGDLVDNSVDAANNNATKNDLSKFLINITFDDDHFSITDNAGGIEEDIARKSAFKLGKPKNFNFGKHTIGQFGIGMKRAFFKLGEDISVESVALKSDFKLKISVSEWKDRPNDMDWSFKFDSVNTKNHSLETTKTSIRITDLKPDVMKQFGDPQFLLDLKNEIRLEHLVAINKGLEIKINSRAKLTAPKITLISNSHFKPCYWSYAFQSGLKAEILAGISEDKGEDGGWYIFCNDRLVLGPDTTELTGWKGGRGRAGAEGKELPKYHDQYFRFRGYVFFNADDSSNLPWTTSKTGIDKDSPAFSFVRTKMIELAKQVKPLMDDMKTERERDNPTEKRLLNNKVIEADANAVLDVSTILAKAQQYTSPTYKYPQKLLNPAPKKSDSRIAYTKPLKDVKKVMEYFSVDTPSDAGSETFDYFYKNQFGNK